MSDTWDRDFPRLVDDLTIPRMFLADAQAGKVGEHLLVYAFDDRGEVGFRFAVNCDERFLMAAMEELIAEFKLNADDGPNH